MHIKQKTKYLVLTVCRLPIWVIVTTVSFASMISLILLCFAMFNQERTVQFSYTGNTCIPNITLLPDDKKQPVDNYGFSVKNAEIIKFVNINIISFKTCFVAETAPLEGDTIVSLSSYGGWLTKKTFKLVVPSPPSISSAVLKRPLSIKNAMSIELSDVDLVFDYQLNIDKKYADCPVAGNNIICDIAPLGLLQGKEYDIKLNRIFDNRIISTLIDTKITTIDAISVIGSSVIQDQVIYDNLKSFTFDFDKEVIGCDIKLNKVKDNERTSIEATVAFDNKNAAITATNNFERGSSYEIIIDNVISTDGSTLVEPYTQKFSVSDGPSVISVNVARFGLSLSKVILLTFDQELSAGQNISEYVSVTGVSASITKYNNIVKVSYANAPMCTTINIHIRPGIISNYSVIQNDAWDFATRTLCHTESVIGYSVEGRAIKSYTFGNGSQTILYTGSIHGNEASTKYLMDEWINELEANFYSIPSDKKIVVVPVINPDGLAANRRNNSNNIDLNRNFPTGDWQTDVFAPNNQPVLGGGGASPLSEPESQAIANLTALLSPRLSVSFHSAAGYAIANQAGDSVDLAAKYSRLSGYANMSGVSNAFNYPITGTYDDWMREAHGLTSLLIELSSSYNSQFSRNVDALWEMARS